MLWNFSFLHLHVIENWPETALPTAFQALAGGSAEHRLDLITLNHRNNVPGETVLSILFVSWSLVLKQRENGDFEIK